MKFKRVAAVFVAFAALVFGVRVQAEIPQRMTYDGYYEDNGTPFNGYLTVRLRLFTNNIASTNEWSANYLYEDTNLVWASNGFYSTVLGDTTTAGSLTNALASGTAFLEIEANGNIQLPREPLLPVAYALQAAGVKAGGITGAMIANGAVGPSQIAGEAVSGYQLAPDAVSGSRIADGSIATNDLDLAGVDARYVNATGDTMTGPLCINVGSSNDLVITNSGAAIAIGQAATGTDQGIAVGPGANAQHYGVAIGKYAASTWSGVGVGLGADGYNEGAALGYRANARVGGVAVGTFANGRNNGIAVGYRAVAAVSNNIAIGFCASNAVENSALVRGSLYLDGGTGVFYRSTFGTGVWSNLIAETDPLWRAASNGIQTQINGKLSSNAWALADSTTNTVRSTGGTMTGPLGINVAPFNSLVITNTGDGIMLGCSADGTNCGISIGFQSKGYQSGAGLGFQAWAYYNGAAVGYQAHGERGGAALGKWAEGQDNGAAVGFNAKAYNNGVAVGSNAYGINGGIAIGCGAIAPYGSTNRIAIGNAITNVINNSIAVRGSLYLDGGAGIYCRPTFGSGSWSNLLDGSSTSSNCVKKTGDTMSGALTIQSDLTVNGRATIAYLPPQGDLPMGIYTNMP